MSEKIHPNKTHDWLIKSEEENAARGSDKERALQRKERSGDMGAIEKLFLYEREKITSRLFVEAFASPSSTVDVFIAPGVSERE